MAIDCLHPDDVVSRYKREPVIGYEDRKEIISSISGVALVVEDCKDFLSPSMIDNINEYSEFK